VALRAVLSLVAVVVLSATYNPLSHQRFQGSAFRTRTTDAPPPTLLTTPVLHVAFVDEPYEAVLRAEGGRGNYRWALSSGHLPDGLKLDPNKGRISGRARQAGNFSFTVTAGDSAGTAVSRAFQLEVSDLAFDKYGGFAKKPSPKGASGFFRVEQFGHRWMLIDPLGNAFWSIGVGAVDPYDGGKTLKEALQQKYAPGQAAFPWWPVVSQWARRMHSWGFNAMGVFSSTYSLPIGTYGRPSGNPVQMPFVWMLRISLAAMKSNAGVKDLIYGTDTMGYRGWRAGPLPDVFDARFEQAARAIAGANATGPPFSSPLNATPWLIGLYPDQLDELFGFRNLRAANPGWIAATTSPVQTWNAVRKALYTDTTVYTKRVWGQWLQQKYRTIGALDAAWGSNYTTFGSSGQAVFQESVGRGDGVRRTFDCTLVHPNVSPHSVSILVNDSPIAGDDGEGHIAGPGVTSGSVNYAPGAISMDFSSPPAAGASVMASYISGGWPKHVTESAGLLDEDGTSPWIGTDSNTLKATSPAVAADMNAFLSVLADQYFSSVIPPIRAAFPHNIIFGPTAFQVATRPQILAAAAKYADVIPVSISPVDLTESGASAAIQTLYRATRKPIVALTTVTANGDSPFAKYATAAGWDFPTQVRRGENYSESLAAAVGTEGFDGIFPVVGFEVWELADKPAERANFGLVTDLDNAYDGWEAVIARGADSWGYPTGGEEANYGNYIGSVRNANLQAFKTVLSMLP
jgi:Putative Ig domain